MREFASRANVLCGLDGYIGGLYDDVKSLEQLHHGAVKFITNASACNLSSRRLLADPPSKRSLHLANQSVHSGDCQIHHYRHGAFKVSERDVEFLRFAFDQVLFEDHRLERF